MQDLGMLFGLRNDLMHIKSYSVVAHGEGAKSSPIPSRVQELARRKLTRTARHPDRTHWIRSLMTPKVARWACLTSWEACRFVAGHLDPPVLVPMFANQKPAV